MAIKGTYRVFVFTAIVLSLFVSPVFSKTADKVQDVLKREIIRRTPSYEKAKIDLSFRDLSEIAVFDGKENLLKFKVSYPENMRFAGEVVIPIDVYSGSDFLRRVNLRTTVKIFSGVLSASQKIKKGDLFSSANVEVSDKEISYLPSDLVFNEKTVVGKQSATYLPKGAVILGWMAKDAPSIKNGSTVDLIKLLNGILVKVKAVAVEDGYINGTIRVKNVDSKKVVEARVLSSREVEAI